MLGSLAGELVGELVGEHQHTVAGSLQEGVHTGLGGGVNLQLILGVQTLVPLLLLGTSRIELRNAY